MRLKKLELSVLLALCITIALSCADFSYRCSDIRERVFRLHILANSDSKADQHLKILVRDRLLDEGLQVFSESDNIDETIIIAKQNIDIFSQVATDELQKNNCNYKVSAEVSPCYFNTRTYGDTTLPAGEYTALQIKIGKGEGKNWWCVMYPSLCIASSGQKIDDVLPEDETQIVKHKNKYVVKFKVVEWYESLKGLFKA